MPTDRTKSIVLDVTPVFGDLEGDGGVARDARAHACEWQTRRGGI